MLYLLDTDTCSFALRGHSQALDVRLAAAQAGALAISAVTRAELVFGLEKRGRPRALSRLVHGLLDRLATQPWDAAAADRFGRLRARLERGGTPIGLLDTMIAAHALALGAVLVTHNTRHFQRVAGLAAEDWTA